MAKLDQTAQAAPAIVSSVRGTGSLEQPALVAIVVVGTRGVVTRTIPEQRVLGVGRRSSVVPLMIARFLSRLAYAIASLIGGLSDSFGCYTASAVVRHVHARTPRK